MPNCWHLSPPLFNCRNICFGQPLKAWLSSDLRFKYALHNLLVKQAVVAHELADVVAVVEGLLHAEAEGLHLCRSVEACYAVAKTSVDAAVLKCHNELVVGLQVVEQTLIGARDVARVDERGIDALLGEHHALPCRRSCRRQ